MVSRSIGIGLGRGFGKLGMTLMLAAAGAQAAVAGPAASQVDSHDQQPVVVAQFFDGREEEPVARPLPTIPQAFNQAYYNRRGNYFDNRQIWQSFSLIFGIRDFPEQAISRDGRTINRLYKEVLEQQVSSDPVLRTPDLPNPYTGSILTTPLVITEDAVEAAPMFPPIRRPDAEPAPRAPQPSPPIPALW